MAKLIGNHFFRGKIRKSLRIFRLLLALNCFFLVQQGNLCAQTVKTSLEKTMYVKKKDVARDKPSTSGKKLFTINVGDRVTVITEQNGWSKIRTIDLSTTAWVKSSVLSSKKVKAKSGNADADQIALAGKGNIARVVVNQNEQNTQIDDSKSKKLFQYLEENNFTKSEDPNDSYLFIMSHNNEEKYYYEDFIELCGINTICLYGYSSLATEMVNDDVIIIFDDENGKSYFYRKKITDAISSNVFITVDKCSIGTESIENPKLYLCR